MLAGLLKDLYGFFEVVGRVCLDTRSSWLGSGWLWFSVQVNLFFSRSILSLDDLGHVSVLITSESGSRNFLWMLSIDIHCTGCNYQLLELLVFVTFCISIVIRFEKRVYIPLPEKHARTEIFKIHIGNTPNTLTDSDYKSLGAETDGWVMYTVFSLLSVWLTWMDVHFWQLMAHNYIFW